MVSPYVVHFTNGVCEQTRKHHTRRIREYRADGFCHRVAFGGDVQKPALRNENERDVCKDADFDAAACFFFAKDFAHDVSRKERRREYDVTERGVKPEGVHENEHFNVSGNGADDGPCENALLAEKNVWIKVVLSFRFFFNHNSYYKCFIIVIVFP